MLSTGASQNPALHGWLLELWFFASIVKGGFEFKDSEVNELHKWGEYACSLFDPLHVTAEDFMCNKWLKPKKWNQGGYDAVNLHDGIVTFVQVTRAKKHALNYSYFQMLVCKLLYEVYFDVQEIKIFFVFPEAQEGIKVKEIDYGSFIEFLEASGKRSTFSSYKTIRAVGM